MSIPFIKGYIIYSLLTGLTFRRIHLLTAIVTPSHPHKSEGSSYTDDHADQATGYADVRHSVIPAMAAMPFSIVSSSASVTVPLIITLAWMLPVK